MSLDVDARLPRHTRARRVDRRRACREVEVATRHVQPFRIGLNAVQLLSCGRPERRQRGVRDGIPDEERVRSRQVGKVVVHRRAGRGTMLDPDVAVRPRARNTVVDADVVRDRRPGRSALDVYAGGDVVVHGVAEDGLTGRRVVVDAVVAVVVADVVDNQVVARTGERLDSGVFVVVRPVRFDGIARRVVEADAGRASLEALRVVEGLVALDEVPGRAVEIDPVARVVVDGVSGNR